MPVYLLMSTTTTFTLKVNAKQLRIISACVEDRAAHYAQKVQAYANKPERSYAHEHYTRKLDASYALLIEIDKQLKKA